MMKPRMLGLFVLGLMIALGLVVWHQQPTATATTSDRRVAGRGRPSMIQIQASELYDAYDANEIQANERFGGRTLRVLGTIEQIAVDRTGTPYVQLETRGLGVRANFTAGADGLSGLRKGADVAVTCIGVGRSMSIHLKDCRLD